VAWIVGVGPTAGLGAAVARRFAQAGYVAAITGRTAGRLEAVAEEIRAAGGEASVFVGDVSDEASIKSVATQLRSLGPLKAAVFNAGAQVRAPTLELTAQEFEQAWRTTTLGGFIFAQSAIKALLENKVAADDPQGHGSVIFTGATGSLRGKPPFAAFASAKAGLRSLSQSLAREFGPQGVHVAHVVIDGGINGERLRSAAPGRVAQAGTDGLLQIEAIAETYWQLHLQHRSAWTHEADLRPFKEAF
jgi:NAD(P)-dependent dehydrogenase (short-subunit alcohol dehydrogenase family)